MIERDPYQEGEQPCHQFTPLIGAAGGCAEAGLCLHCSSKVRFCTNCRRDHHFGGSDDCPGYRRAALPIALYVMIHLLDVLWERQLALIAGFFHGDLSQAQILTKHHVSKETYRRWQFDTAFTDEMERRIGAAHRESAAIIARFAAQAAVRLIELTKSPKEEIARKACLDIIALGRAGSPVPPAGSPVEAEQAPALSEEMASKMLGLLADAASQPSPSEG